jgi:hypothetical protein
MRQKSIARKTKGGTENYVRKIKKKIRIRVKYYLKVLT